MKGLIKYVSLSALLLCTWLDMVAQDVALFIPADSLQPDRSTVTVGNIIISGNKKTKDAILLREIPFRPEDKLTLAELVEKFETARRQLMNTALFQSVVVALKDTDGDRVSVSVLVKERWYLFPVPYLKPVDRNLNQWVVEQKASFSRVNYGAKLLYNNATGNNDKLRLWLVNGYTKQVSASYDRLYLDKKMKWGISGSFAFGKNREVNYNTVLDKQVFLKDNDHYLRSFFNAHAELTYRKAINTRHYFGAGFTVENIKDTVVALNPSYFKSGKNNIRFPSLYYTLQYNDLDYIPYPTKGYAAKISLQKRGLNNTINMWGLSAKGFGSWHLSPKYFLSTEVYGAIKVPFKQPWFNQRFLGYGDIFMQGYEYYVIDGVAGGYCKGTLYRDLFRFGIRLPGKKGKYAERIPFRIIGKTYGNAGYVYNPVPGENFLTNKMLYSGGFGIDILTFYDITIKLEYTFNQVGQNGLFLHRKTIF
jgi:hypothetical protein